MTAKNSSVILSENALSNAQAWALRERLARAGYEVLTEESVTAEASGYHHGTPAEASNRLILLMDASPCAQSGTCDASCAVENAVNRLLSEAGSAGGVTVIDHGGNAHLAESVLASSANAYISLPSIEAGGMTFWGDEHALDADGDGRATFAERFAGAFPCWPLCSTEDAGSFLALGRSYADGGLAGAGRDASTDKPALEIESAKDFWRAIDTLLPGQYAVAYFGNSEWCPSCREYEPQFGLETMEAGGRYVFLHVKDPEAFAPYEIEYFPMRRVFGMGLPREGLEIGNRLDLLDCVGPAIAEHFAHLP